MPADPKPQNNEALWTPADFKGVDLIKHIEHPEPYLARRKAALAARSGQYPNTGCPHPVTAVQQFFDDAGTTDRQARPTNLMECTLCHSLLWLVDPYGKAAQDG